MAAPLVSTFRTAGPRHLAMPSRTRVQPVGAIVLATLPRPPGPQRRGTVPPCLRGSPCSHPTCPNSGQVADRLTALGYTDVRKYREGIQDWMEADLPTESA